MALPLILGSSSPWRLTLLERIGVIPDLIVAPEIDEGVTTKDETPTLYSRRIAHKKALAVRERYPDAVIISADTVASVGRRILGKPKDAEEAARFLSLLSGRRHRVYTTVCVYSPSRGFSVRQQVSIVKFKRLHASEIKQYLLTHQWQNCAGGYTIQGCGEVFIQWIRGSTSAILGLPTYETYLLLLQHLEQSPRFFLTRFAQKQNGRASS